MDSLPKVVQIGFNKCGTRSLAKLFDDAGYPTIHRKVRKPFRKSQNAARIMKYNLSVGNPVFHGMENYIFFSDLNLLTESEMFEGYRKFREIIRDYPDTIFILNLRDREAWIQSRLRHGHGEYAQRAMKQAQICNLDDLADLWRRHWDEHIADVRAFMTDYPGQLIEFNLDADPVEKLTTALSRYGLNPDSWADTGNSRVRRLSPVIRAVKRWWSHLGPRNHC